MSEFLCSFGQMCALPSIKLNNKKTIPSIAEREYTRNTYDLSPEKVHSIMICRSVVRLYHEISCMHDADWFCSAVNERAVSPSTTFQLGFRSKLLR